MPAANKEKQVANYEHWDDESTLSKLFGDRPTVREMAQAFLSQYPKSIQLLLSPDIDPRLLANELHSLRSQFGIFHADTAHAMAVCLDRSLRAGDSVSVAELRRLAAEMRAVARELEHFIAN